ncbi:DNA mismatch repair protein MutS2 [Mariniphaga anaerophila]|uniref:Endonuclease MutS2 n=1 Tax=Mariniphaga anaerophila TaxID=1484053 RepID=A0A1M5FFY7_9BACT|nr:Smr/MutS family protein [Mariniphaga anaerophila]SHF90398.1 DNA mismatch repair protein MutS2 [Mariniphaga anaerophila]
MQNIWPQNFEEKVGFNRVREMLKNKCLSTMGTEWVDAMHFHDNFETITRQLGETNEFCRIIREVENFPSDHFYDLRSALKKIRIEGRFLETRELFDLKRSLESIRAIVQFFKKQNEDTFPLLKEKTEPVQIFPYIYDRIEAILNKFGKIRDNASPELAQIRKSILALQSSMSKRLHAILKQAQKDGLVDEDASVSIRDGRAVIPVSASNKRKIKGIVYDESATGKTSYVEPNEIVEMNNETRELEYAERREIMRILIEFSNDIRPYLSDLVYSYEFLGEIDFIRAKALLAVEFDAIFPVMQENPLIQWQKAVHPLLQQALKRENRKIIPLDIHLDEKNHILLISGPNAGGKSVCLKTVGLLQYMLQCGLLIPVNEASTTGIFQQLFIDIGDEQSLENDLSTYSSHLLNMKHFAKNSNANTLVLIDEFGTGTEPMLGGAIAEAILDELNQLRAFGVITTHYTNLKHFASSADGIVNGAMLYDAQNMNPLFQLEIGKPGSSFAFEIARKIGLPEKILEKATEKIGKKHIDFDRNLRKINRDQRYWEIKREKIRKVEKILDNMAANYETELKETQKQRKEIIKKAREDAENLLSGVNKQIENTILEIKKAQAEKEKTKDARKKLEKLKSEVVKSSSADDDQSISAKMDKLRRREEKRNKKRPVDSKKDIGKKKPEKQVELKPGDKVRIAGQQTIGDLIELNDKNAVVAFGQLITTLPRKQVERLSNNEAKKVDKEKRSGNGTRLLSNFSERRLTFKPEIDIRGQRAEEAIPKIQEFIDEAIMFEVAELRILHGKGHGILKETIRSYLRSEPMVKSMKDEHVDFGGAGITVVTLAL